jgi:hypothetical protein
VHVVDAVIGADAYAQLAGVDHGDQVGDSAHILAYLNLDGARNVRR